MATRVRTVATIEEFADAFGAIGHYFGQERDLERAERISRLLPLERMLAAWDGGRIVAGLGSFPFELSIPGGYAACAGTTVVGVLPTHRRRGLLARLMRAHLDDAHARGEPLAALWASEETIYGRYGYGLASWHASLTIPAEHDAFARPLERRGEVRLVGVEEARRLVPGAYERVRRRTPGMLSRSGDWWELRRLADLPHQRGGSGPLQVALLELDGRVCAYALYRITNAFRDGVSDSTLRVVEALGDGPQATAEIWRFLLDVDWMARVEAEVAVDHPLFLLLAHPRRLGARIGDALWLRLVDVGAALAARAYADDTRIALEVDDAFCAWNAGTWVVEGGRVRRSRRRADLRLPVDALGSAYLGGAAFAQLVAAGRAEELVRGAARKADRVFRTGHPAPWCPEIF